MLRLVLACLALCFSYNIALAKYCVKLPSCEDLGYVLPYKEGRRQIRCPFDTDKALYLDYCQAYGIQGKPDETAGEYQECIEEKADGTKINTGYYRYTRCNVGYRYESGHCIRYSCNTPHTCQVGDVYLYDNEPIGVVFFDDGTTTKIVALRNVDANGEEYNGRLTWLGHSRTENDYDYAYDVPNLTNIKDKITAIEDTDGKSNTNAILAFSASDGHTTQAATATSLYAPSICGSGTMCTKGNWYLPALGELNIIYNNLSKIDGALDKVNGTILEHDNYFYFWSSTESSNALAWSLLFSTGDLKSNGKYGVHIVRPALAF